MSVVAVLTAAGSGIRLGCDGPKALVTVGAMTLLEHAVHGLAASGCVDLIVVTAPAAKVETFQNLFAAGSTDDGVPLEVVEGSSASRQASVWRGVSAALHLRPDADVIVVHDAARALTPPEVIIRVVEAVKDGHDAVVPGLAVTDTIKEVAHETQETSAQALRVISTPDRSHLRSVQTPQGFRADVLVRAHDHGASRGEDESLAASDDAALVEALGYPVVVVPGDARAFKVTTPFDLALAELLISSS